MYMHFNGLIKINVMHNFVKYKETSLAFMVMAIRFEFVVNGS